MPLTDLSRQLRAFQQGDLSLEEMLELIADHPFERFALGRIDHLRSHRTGVPEAIFAEGKEVGEVLELLERYHDAGRSIFATRCPEALLDAVAQRLPEAFVCRTSRICSTVDPDEVAISQEAHVAVVSAGALDRQVAEEAAVSCRLLGLRVERTYDVGVAGLNRLLPEVERLRRAHVVIVVAGMDGALPSVLGGLLEAPIVAVPTHVGYGAAFHGLSALLAMLNSCSPGVAVCNIDNGFGAAAVARKIISRAFPVREEV